MTNHSKKVTSYKCNEMRKLIKIKCNISRYTGRLNQEERGMKQKNSACGCFIFARIVWFLVGFFSFFFIGAIEFIFNTF